MFKSKRKVYPIYLKSISLKNIKCFGPEQTLLLHKDNKPSMWTIILGDNGTGKSTILQTISLALSQHEEDSSYFNIFKFSRKEKEMGICKVKVFSQNGKYWKKKSWDISRDAYLKVEGPNLRSYNIPVFGYGSFRKLGNRGLSGIDVKFQSHSLFDENSDLINAEDWLLQADYEKEKSNYQINQVEKVKNILLKIFREEISAIDIKKKGFGYGVYFKTRYGWVNIKDLSTGYRSLVTWMVDLSNWLTLYYPNSADPLQEQAIVLVDEIDLHLHVSLQKKLVGFLKETFPKVQFIVTAHSPLIVQGSEEENIIILEKNNDHILIKDNPTNVKNWRIDQILTSDLFGLNSARSKKTEAKMKRRSDLISKETLNKTEKEEVKKLNEFIHEVPTNESTVDNEASKIIREAAETLKKLRKQ